MVPVYVSKSSDIFKPILVINTLAVNYSQQEISVSQKWRFCLQRHPTFPANYGDEYDCVLVALRSLLISQNYSYFRDRATRQSSHVAFGSVHYKAPNWKSAPERFNLFLDPHSSHQVIWRNAIPIDIINSHPSVETIKPVLGVNGLTLFISRFTLKSSSLLLSPFRLSLPLPRQSR